MPAGLERVAFTFNVIGKSGALSDRMVALTTSQRGLGFLEDSKLSEDSLVGSVVLGLEKFLCTSRD